MSELKVAIKIVRQCEKSGKLFGFDNELLGFMCNPVRNSNGFISDFITTDLYNQAKEIVSMANIYKDIFGIYLNPIFWR